MWKRSSSHLDQAKLDRFGEELLHVIEASEAEIDRAAASPFLYRRILARIEAERRRRSEEWSKWLALLKEIKHAVPLFAIIAIAVATFVWQESGPGRNAQATNNSSASQLSSAGELLPVSNDEMINSLVGWNERSSNQHREQ